jgi:hypothetical protein
MSFIEIDGVKFIPESQSHPLLRRTIPQFMWHQDIRVQSISPSPFDPETDQNFYLHTARWDYFDDPQVRDICRRVMAVFNACGWQQPHIIFGSITSMLRDEPLQRLSEFTHQKVVDYAHPAYGNEADMNRLKLGRMIKLLPQNLKATPLRFAGWVVAAKDAPMVAYLVNRYKNFVMCRQCKQNDIGTHLPYHGAMKRSLVLCRSCWRRGELTHLARRQPRFNREPGQFALDKERWLNLALRFVAYNQTIGVQDVVSTSLETMYNAGMTPSQAANFDYRRAMDKSGNRRLWLATKKCDQPEIQASQLTLL